MDTNEENKLLLKEDVFQIVGAAMNVLNELGTVIMRSRTRTRLLLS